MSDKMELPRKSDSISIKNTFEKAWNKVAKKLRITLSITIIGGLVWYGSSIEGNDYSHIAEAPSQYQAKENPKDNIKELLTEVFDPDNKETWYNSAEISKMTINSSESPWEQINGQPFSKIFMGAYGDYISPYFIRAEDPAGRYIKLYYHWNDDILACKSCGTVMDNPNAEQQCLYLKGDPRDPVWSGQRKFKISGELNQDYYVFQSWVCESRGCTTKLQLGGDAVRFTDCYK